MDTNNESPASAFAPATGYATREHAGAVEILRPNGEVVAVTSRRRSRAIVAELNALMADSSRLDWLDRRLDYFGRISLRLQGNPERCIIAEEAPDECGNYHNGDEIGSSAGKLLRSAIDAGMSHNEAAHPRASGKETQK